MEMAKPNADRLKDHAEALRDLSADALDAVRQLIKEVRDETLELVQSGQDQVEALGDATGAAVANHPYRTIGIALGVGCLFGIMISRR